VLLNGGVDPSTNKTIIPKWVFDEVTTAHFITTMDVGVDTVAAYGEGWFVQSYQGQEVCMRYFVHRVVADKMLYFRLFSTQVLWLASPPLLLSSPKEVFPWSY
jgi:hypothetical protein